MCITGRVMELWETVFAGCGKALCFSTGCERCFPSVEWPVMHISTVRFLTIPSFQMESHHHDKSESHDNIEPYHIFG